MKIACICLLVLLILNSPTYTMKTDHRKTSQPKLTEWEKERVKAWVKLAYEISTKNEETAHQDKNEQSLKASL